MMHGTAARVAFNANLRGDNPVYVGLVTAPIADGALSVTEAIGASYARVRGTWSAATGTTGASTTNTNEIVFPVAAEDWGIVTGFAVFDALTGGNLLYSGALVSPISVSPEITVVFEAGSLDLVF